MFRVKSGAGEFAVVFATQWVDRLTATGVEQVQQTRALVHVFEKGGFHPVAGLVGFAYRAPEDRPNDWIGRMWALERAVDSMPALPRMDILDAFWRARLADEALDAAFDEQERQADIQQVKNRFAQLYAEAQECKTRLAELEGQGQTCSPS